MKPNELVKQMISNELKNIHTALPAKIDEFNAEEMTAEITPLAKRKISGEEYTMPKIVGVPVSHIKFGPFIMRPAYTKGDVVQVLFNERAIEKLLITGDPESVQYNRRFSIDDAVVIKGLKIEQESNYPSTNTKDLLIMNQDTGEKIIMKKTGGITVVSVDVKLGSDNASNALPFLSELNEFIDNYNNHTHGGAVGPPISIADKTGTQKVVAE